MTQVLYTSFEIGILLAPFHKDTKITQPKGSEMGYKHRGASPDYKQTPEGEDMSLAILKQFSFLQMRSLIFPDFYRIYSFQ